MSYRRNNSPPVLGGCAGVFIAVFLIIVLLTAGKAFAVQPCWNEVNPTGQECELTQQEMNEVAPVTEQEENEAITISLEPEPSESDSPVVAEVSSVARKPTPTQGVAGTPPVRVAARVCRANGHFHHTRHSVGSRRKGERRAGCGQVHKAKRSRSSHR